MKYACLVYHDYAELAGVTDKELDATLCECGNWIGELERNNAHVFSAGLASPSNSSSVRRQNGRVIVTDGPFSETKEVLGGFTIIEARDLNEAIQIASKFPGSEFGRVEVRPVFDPNLDWSDPVDKRLATALKRTAETVTSP